MDKLYDLKTDPYEMKNLITESSDQSNAPAIAGGIDNALEPPSDLRFLGPVIPSEVKVAFNSVSVLAQAPSVGTGQFRNYLYVLLSGCLVASNPAIAVHEGIANVATVGIASDRSGLGKQLYGYSHQG